MTLSPDMLNVCTYVLAASSPTTLAKMQPPHTVVCQANTPVFPSVRVTAESAVVYTEPGSTVIALV